MAWIAFCEDVIAKKFNFRIDDDEFASILKDKYKMPDGKIQKTMNSPVRSFTNKSMEKSKEELKKLQDRLEYLKGTSPEVEWINDLEELKKAVKMGFGTKK
jgi:succinate dehydrogenase/fumarate reductase flavoprotein subunit